jgi:hypothetical protein
MKVKDLVFECSDDSLTGKVLSHVKLPPTLKKPQYLESLTMSEILEALHKSADYVDEDQFDGPPGMSDTYYKVYAKRKLDFRKKLSQQIEDLIYREFLMSLTDEELLKKHFAQYSRRGQKFSADWLYEYFNTKSCYVDLNLEYSNKTDSGNFSCGDEAEHIYSQPLGRRSIYWALTSSGGPSGPYLNVDEAIESIGYSPAILKRRKGWREYH